MIGNWNYPTPIRFGNGRIAELAQACTELGISKPLLVTDADLVKLPPVKKALEALETGGLAVALFSGIEANPKVSHVTEGVAAYHEDQCDGVIAFGGGSPLDAAKTIALMVGQDRPLLDFVDEGDNYKRAKADAIAPIVAVPTTSGTGSEVGRASVITDTVTQNKKLIFHPKMQPSRVIADPELTAGMPPGLTAATGMDALAHNLEAVCSPFFHPMAEAIGFEGIRLVDRSLVKAYRDGFDMEARGEMLAASIMGSTAFQKGLGAVHSLSHPLGGRFGIHHGMLNAVLMPYVLEFNRPALGDKWNRLEHILGQDPLEWLLQLRETLAIPHTLEALDVPSDAKILQEIARAATADPSAGSNPVPLDDASHLLLLERALAGELLSR